MFTSILATKMALKKCSYKGCRSIHTPDNPSRETFFQFPKDETRYEIWMAMSRCEDRSKSPKYLCSKHFDHSKYMSSNPRRNLLLANAVPFPYQSDTEDSEEEERLQDVVSTQYGDDDFFAIRESIDEGGEHTVSEESGIVIQFAESTDNQQVEIVNQSSDFHKTSHAQPEQRKAPKPEVIEYYRKRKAPETSISEEQAAVKIIKLRPVQSQGVKSSPRCEVSLNNISSNSSRGVKAEKLETAEEEVVMDPSITTFIFKSEEYVQMPKKLYLDEKLEMLRELQYYKDIVVNFKNLLDNVKL